MLRKFRRTVNQLIRRDLLSRISEALFNCEEGFFTEWKLGNTPNKKPRDPAFGGVFFCPCIKKERCPKSPPFDLSLCEQHIAAAARIMYRLEHVCRDTYKVENCLRQAVINY